MPTVKQPELLTFILHKHLKCYMKTDKCFKYYKTPSNGIQSGQIQYPNKWSTLSFYTKNALAKRISVRVTIQHIWIWSLKCNRDFQRSKDKDIKHCQWGEDDIYERETQANWSWWNFAETEWKQYKIGTDNEKSHVVQSHGVGFGTGHILWNSVLKIETSQAYFLGFDSNKIFKST